MRRGWKLAIGIVTLVARAFVGVATSTTPGRNGLIVYAQELSPGRFQLFTIHPDGTRKKQITRVRSAANPDTLRSSGKVRHGAHDLDVDVGQLGRKPLLESPLIVLDVREDPLPVVKAH